MAFKIGEMFWKIKADTKDFDTGAKKTEKTTNKLAKTMTSAGKLITAGFAVAIVAGIANVSKELIVAASNAEETRNKFNVVFGDVSDAAVATAADIKKEFGLSTQATENFLSSVGDITSGLGATGEEALDAAEQITTLGLDIDSFANLTGGAAQAVSALTSLFTGEREAAKQLGIVINDNNLKQYAEDTGKVFSELTALEKGFLSLELATTQSQLAIGDAVRSADSYANTAKRAASSVSDFSAALGRSFLPAATLFQSTLGKIAQSFAEYSIAANDAKDAADNLFEITQGRGDALKAYDDLAKKVQEAKDALAAGGSEFTKFARANDLTKRTIDAYIVAQDLNLEKLRLRVEREEAVTTAAKESADAAIESAEKEATAADARLQATKDYIEFIEGEYSSTNEGKIEQLKNEIALIEQNIGQYGGLRDEQQLLIDLKKEEIEQLDGTAAARLAIEEKSAADQIALIDEVQAAKEEVEARNQQISDDEAARIQTLTDQWLGYAGIISSNVQGAFNELGAALVTSEASWKILGKAAVNTVADIIDALGAELAARAAILAADAFFTLGATLGPAAAAAAASAAAFTAAGAIRAGANKFEEGGIVPGNNFSGDNVPAAVNSGEMVLTKQQQNELFRMANGGSGSGGGSQTIIIQMDRQVLYKAVNDGARTGKLVLPVR